MIHSNGEIRVAVVEDDDSFREHLAALIGGAKGFRWLGGHRTAEAALKQLHTERPDVLLLDLELPKTSGLEFIPSVLARWRKLAILVLTISDDSARIYEALGAGAIGYLIKPVSPARLLEAIADAHAGGSPMSSQIARLIVKRFQHQGHTRKAITTLTPRETEILGQFARGLHTMEVAELLSISDRTVSTHLRNIYEKLHVSSRSAAVAKFLSH